MTTTTGDNGPRPTGDIGRAGQTTARFDITSAVVRQLGDQLITDEVTALLELVKNAYDADAGFVRVIVDTNAVYGGTETYFDYSGDHSAAHLQGRRQSPVPSLSPQDPPGILPRSRIGAGYILVEDDGTGMDETDIERGWLTISLSGKRSMKRDDLVTPKRQRTPLGDKGLGRLSAQRIGSKLEMFTVKERPDPPVGGAGVDAGDIAVDRMWVLDETEHLVAVDWDLFNESALLSQVPVHLETRPLSRPRRGTRLLISDLRNRTSWQGESLKNLTQGLTQLITPFVTEPGFKVYLTVNGETVDFERVSQRVRKTALTSYAFSFDGKKVSVKGMISLRLFIGNDAPEDYMRALGNDQGRAFADYLQEKGSLGSDVDFFTEDGWFLEYTWTRDVPFGGLELVETAEPPANGDVPAPKRLIVSPGPFAGELDQFRFNRLEEVGLRSLSDVFNSAADYKQYVRKYAGVRIYRDGFGVRPYGINGEDWLGLSKGQTVGSFYGLRPGNVVGYVSISARDNQALEEKTDREGFTETAASRNFFKITEEVVERINSTLRRLRRLYDAYRDTLPQIDTALTPSSAIEDIRGVSVAAERIEEDGLVGIARAAVHVDALLNAGPQSPDARKAVEAVRVELAAAESTVRALQAVRSQASQLSQRADLIQRRIERYRQQLADVTELAGLGLTAEALSHELANVADRIAQETSKVRRDLKQRGVVVAEVTAYVESMRSVVSSIRKQVSHIAPSLRYVRETQEDIEMRPFFEGIKEYYEGLAMFSDPPIRVVLDEPFESFSVQMNRGRLTQVVDNLFLNAGYWLRQAHREGLFDRAGTAGPTITVRSHAPFIDVSDNGEGIHPTAMAAMFEPFNTMKPGGRGLGLFIIRQLLDSSSRDGNSIYVLPDRNEYGRQYSFRIDLGTSVVADAHGLT